MLLRGRGTGALLPLTLPATGRQDPTTLPAIATECWDRSMSTGHSSHGFCLSFPCQSSLAPLPSTSLSFLHLILSRL